VAGESTKISIFQIPDKRFKTVKKQDRELKQDFLDRFVLEENSIILFPESYSMKRKRTVSYDEDHQVKIYKGTACNNSRLHENV